MLHAVLLAAIDMGRTTSRPLFGEKG